jgi:hypothetical protein
MSKESDPSVVGTAAVLAVLAIASFVALGRPSTVMMQDRPGFPSWNPVPHTCFPIFTGFALCGEECDPRHEKGEACVVELYSGGDLPMSETVEGWWVVRSLSDGRRSYLYDGRYPVPGPITRFTLCDIPLGYDLEGYGWYEQDYHIYPTYSEVRFKVRRNECDDCQTPTPAPVLPYAEWWPAKCAELLYLPVTARD